MSNMKDKRKDPNYSVFLKHIEEEKNESSKFAKTLLIMALLAIAFIVIVFFFLDDKTIEQIFGKDTYISQKLIEFVDSKLHRTRASFNLPFLPHRQTILLLGVDASNSPTDPWTGTRSDTIVLMSVDPATHSVNAISVPRDSKVYIADHNGVQKINAAHAIGGVQLTKRTIEETLGVKIDKYIVVSDEAVKRLVNALGGVPTYVEKNMSYDDYSGKLHVHLRKGVNVLDGQNAVCYLRFRHDGLGDIGRTQRQQWFLRGLLEKLQSPQAIPKIPEMVNIANTYVKTDMSLYELSQYAALAKSMDISKIEVATLPGSPNKRGSISYWILDPEKTQEVVNRLIYRDEPQITSNASLKAGIMYSPEKQTQAMAIKSQLEQLGFQVNCYSRGHLPHSQFIANSGDVSNSFFNRLKSKVPEIKKNQFVYDPNKFFCSNSDFVVIVSGD